MRGATVAILTLSMNRIRYITQSSERTTLGAPKRRNRTFPSLSPFRVLSPHENRFVLDLGAVQNAPRARIERGAAMHRAAVVPKHHVADLPFLAPRQFAVRRVRPEFIQQQFGFR